MIKQLASTQALAFLTELSNEDVADAVELLIRTGRRPTEICHLTETCLQWDERVREDGSLDRQPVLVYRPEKTPKRSKRLPVHAREALIIKRARERTRARFPEMAAGKLPLFPQQTQNRSGRVPLGSPEDHPRGARVGARAAGAARQRRQPHMTASGSTPTRSVTPTRSGSRTRAARRTC